MYSKNHPDFQRQQIKVLYYATLALFLPLCAGIFFLISKEQKQQETAIDEVEIIQPIKISLENTTTTAHSAFVINLETGEVLYEKNPDKLLPLASLTKLITAKVADDEIQSTTLKVHKLQEFAQYGDAQLSEGQTWDKDELIAYTLLTSSNDGAYSLSTNASSNTENFTNKMNTMTAAIGLSQMSFKNETGLDYDAAGIPNTKGTAREMGEILKHLLKNNIELFEKTRHSNTTVQAPQGTMSVSNTNEFADKIPGLLLSKTGYTDLAGGNLAIVADMGLNEPVAFVVLKSSKESRFEDVLKLQEAYFAQIREQMK
jgi:D-alanyl-D-alanine carboxypeptidase